MLASQLLFCLFRLLEYHKSPHNSTVGDDHFLNCADLAFRFSGREQLTAGQLFPVLTRSEDPESEAERNVCVHNGLPNP